MIEDRTNTPIDRFRPFDTQHNLPLRILGAWWGNKEITDTVTAKISPQESLVLTAFPETFGDVKNNTCKTSKRK